MAITTYQRSSSRLSTWLGWVWIVPNTQSIQLVTNYYSYFLCPPSDSQGSHSVRQFIWLKNRHDLRTQFATASATATSNHGQQQSLGLGIWKSFANELPLPQSQRSVRKANANTFFSDSCCHLLSFTFPLCSKEASKKRLHGRSESGGELVGEAVEMGAPEILRCTLAMQTI